MYRTQKFFSINPRVTEGGYNLVTASLMPFGRRTCCYHPPAVAGRQQGLPGEDLAKPRLNQVFNCRWVGIHAQGPKGNASLQ